MSLNRTNELHYWCVGLSQEPSITGQLNSIIQYLNYHGHLFLRIASDRDSNEINEVDPVQTSKSL